MIQTRGGSTLSEYNRLVISTSSRQRIVEVTGRVVLFKGINLEMRGSCGCSVPLTPEVCGRKEANESDYRMIGGSEHARRFYNM